MLSLSCLPVSFGEVEAGFENGQMPGVSAEEGKVIRSSSGFVLHKTPPPAQQKPNYLENDLAPKRTARSYCSQKRLVLRQEASWYRISTTLQSNIRSERLKCCSCTRAFAQLFIMSIYSLLRQYSCCEMPNDKCY